ncbi:DYL1 protein, partial [Steatornis caripensis]|nr:DYL1 protein [Steatornis caripensis]
VTMSDRKAVIKNADMSEEMQQDAVECPTQASEERYTECDIATYIKRMKYNPTWQHAVGRSFVTHKASHFILVCLGPVTVLFKGA